ncbi:MAG: hypothetical protein M1833_001564 [Piccolia ochrophora]|nr:MAG: hypothetical protein M1833_001564 [Piccolia ochrophora]
MGAKRSMGVERQTGDGSHSNKKYKMESSTQHLQARESQNEVNVKDNGAVRGMAGGANDRREKVHTVEEAIEVLVNNPAALKRIIENSEDDGKIIVSRLEHALKLAQASSSEKNNTSRLSTSQQSAPSSSSNTAQPILRADRPLPSLPPIDDPSLLRKVFTYQGLLDAKQSSQSDASYERLEFLGDAYLECIATRIIYGLFPHLHVGRLAQIRENCVCNATLAVYAREYGFHKRLRLAGDPSIKSKSETKVHADIFEAYVAAVIIDHPETGFQLVEEWLQRLWGPRLLKFMDVPLLNREAKQELAKKVMSRGVKLDYIEPRQPQPVKGEPGKKTFFVGVYMTGWGWQGQFLGEGEGINKNEAGMRAATNALYNIPLIDEIAEKKKLFDAATKAQRELEEANGNPA